MNRARIYNEHELKHKMLHVKQFMTTFKKNLASNPYVRMTYLSSTIRYTILEVRFIKMCSDWIQIMNIIWIEYTQ